MALQSPALLEALLFASGDALPKERVMSILHISKESLAEAIAVLTTALSGHGLTLVETDTELELRTSPETASMLSDFRESELSRDIGKASLETLAIILYKNGATRGEIDHIRGVNSATSLRSLLLRGLIDKKEDATDKRRIRYQATIEALAHLGISKKEQLPRYSEYTEGIAERMVTKDTL